MLSMYLYSGVPKILGLRMSENPIIEFSGVLYSCEMLAKKWIFCLLVSSSAFFSDKTSSLELKYSIAILIMFMTSLAEFSNIIVANPTRFSPMVIGKTIVLSFESFSNRSIISVVS